MCRFTKTKKQQQKQQRFAKPTGILRLVNMLMLCGCIASVCAFALVAILGTSHSLKLQALEQAADGQQTSNNSLSIEVAHRQASELSPEHLLVFGFVDVGTIEYAKDQQSVVALR